MREILKPDKQGEVSEAQLQYAIVFYELTQKNSAIGETFRTAYASHREKGSYIDTAIKRALEELVKSGALKKEESDVLRVSSFNAAQLDTKLDQLAGRGGGTNLKSGEAKLEDAINKADAALNS